MTKKKLFIWVCDYSETSGEGKLARFFLKIKSFEEKYDIRLNQKKILKQKYISTLFGILYCWKKYLNNQRVCYLNYLPLWNFLIFMLLPPKTIIGPITGGANFLSSKNSIFIIRKVFFPFFYKISEFFINIRFKKVIFSTDLLKKYLSKKTRKKSEFNFVFKNFSFKTKVKKNYDFIIYYRKNSNKISFFPYKFIKEITSYKYKIIVVGDKLDIKSVKNLGYVSYRALNKIQSRSKFTIASSENIYSFFSLECLSNHNKVLVDQFLKKQVKHFKNKFIFINFNKNYSQQTLKKVLR